MPFAYYARLTRAQQAVYRKSDGITDVRLPRPADLHPLVGRLDEALKTEDRLRTQHATERLIRGLTDALAIPPVKVEVLAARPHAKWGELHGLYTVERGKPPKIQLWMRTAKQKRVVAFRTYMRTLLHEVGHHVDYALLRLPDSFHTEGFYKRESSLFYQLVPEAARGDAPPAVRPLDAWLAAPLDERLARLERTPDELARAMRSRTTSALGRRPAPDAWSATEIVCHVRDTEEQLAGWIRLLLSMDDPVLTGPPAADRWPEERQYARHHPGAAWDAFGRWRDETIALVRGLSPAELARPGRHPRRGRVTVAEIVGYIAWHDDNHLDQLRRALRGQP
jgi:hypothetical protein